MFSTRPFTKIKKFPKNELRKTYKNEKKRELSNILVISASYFPLPKNLNTIHNMFTYLKKKKKFFEDHNLS